MTATYFKYILNFKNPSATSRGVLTEKETWIITLDRDGKKGVGECAMLRGLSIDDCPDYERKLAWTCENIHLGKDTLWELLVKYPSIQFGVEMAFLSLECDDPFILFPSEFTSGKRPIPINGLIWMGNEFYMKRQIEDKIGQGFDCIKLKIGAIDFDRELDLLRFIRQHFSAGQMEIRLDANGAFFPEYALHKLNQIFGFEIHSIEQPIASMQTDLMADLCKSSPIPIALDEELIGIFSLSEKRSMLEKINPQYIILKPSFVGGFRGTKEWISIAEKFGIGWWITSALESNIGLNAIAQWTYLLNSSMHQGLGTGALYTNNFESPLRVFNGGLWYNPEVEWDFRRDFP